MWEALLAVVVGFLLTTVVGGLFGYLLQQRAWTHQYRVGAAATRRERSLELFDELSRLLDKRLYRMRRWYWSLDRDRENGARSEDSDDRRAEYVAVLYEWNDSINRNLAMLQSFFGSEPRRQLDEVIGAEFRQLGADLETMWDDATFGGQNFDRRFRDLENLIYEFNVRLINSIDGVMDGSAEDRGPHGSLK
jgi:hypothetical protein